MLAIVSDLHLSDGTTSIDVHSSAFRLLGQEIRTAAAHKGATEIHLVLLGDILDLVRTDYWHRNGVSADKRPWGGESDPETAMNRDTAEVERQFGEVLDGVVGAPRPRARFTIIKDLGAVGRPQRGT